MPLTVYSGTEISFRSENKLFYSLHFFHGPGVLEATLSVVAKVFSELPELFQEKVSVTGIS